MMFLLSVSTAFALTSADLAGTWNAVATWTGDATCSAASAKGSTTAYQWLVSTSPDGTFTIQVQGETSFPKFGGRVNADGTVVASAYGPVQEIGDEGWIVPLTTMRLTLENGVLSGIRLVNTFNKVSGLNPLVPTQTFSVPCLETAEMTVRR